MRAKLSRRIARVINTIRYESGLSLDEVEQFLQRAYGNAQVFEDLSEEDQALIKNAEQAVTGVT